MADLKQTGIAITTGTDYQLAFTSDVTSGILEVYQGTQLIYSSAFIFLGSAGSLKEYVSVSESTSIMIKNKSSFIFSPVTVSESISLVIA